MWSLIAFCTLTFILPALYHYKATKKSKSRILTVKKDDEAYLRLRNWRMKNPGVYIGLSQEGCKLVLSHINTTEAFLKAYKLKDNYHYIEYLESLLCDFPKPPGKSSKPFSLPAPKGAVSF